MQGTYIQTGQCRHGQALVVSDFFLQLARAIVVYVCRGIVAALDVTMPASDAGFV